MDFLTVTLIAIVCCSLYYYFKRKLAYFDEYGIPYVPGWPLFGNMARAIFFRAHVIDVVKDSYKCSPEAKYVGLFDFNQPRILMRDLELIKTIGIKNFDNFSNHEQLLDDTVDPLLGGNLFNMEGEKWKEARNLLSPAFTSSKMKAMFELMLECGNNFVNYLSERPREENKLINTKDLFTRYTNDVIATCAFGISVDSLKDPKNEFYVNGREATNFEGFQLLKFFLVKASPALMKALRIKFVSERIARFFKNLVSNTIATRDEKGITRPDMLQLMMDARGKQVHLKMDVTEMTAQAFIFFFGGFDTTSTQMCIIAHELAINPDIQKRLQEEIDEVLSESDGKPTYGKINEMLYLDAVFNESLRRHTQVPFLDRVCKEPFELPPAVPGAKPFTLKRGDTVWFPASAIHTDAKYYENPLKFDPDRYYQKKVTINDVYNLGFGIGPRACIGNRFAILETKILFFCLLSKFNLKATEKTCNPFTYSKKSFSIRAEGGFWLALEPRN